MTTSCYCPFSNLGLGGGEGEAEMAISCNCPFKDLGLGGGKGEKAQPGPRLSLQHPPHDLVLHTADIQDHLCRRNGFKMGNRRHGMEFHEVKTE
jgi:hypothetical protein